MTDAALTRLQIAAPPRITASWRGILLIAAAIGATASLVITTPETATLAQAEAGQDLTLLLRFMAIAKATMALAALALTAWRFGFATPPVLAAAYIGAVALMAAAPLLIWQLAHVAAGAALFHAGLLLMLAALFADRGRAPQLAGAALKRFRRA
jgi:hypothetical protein